MISVNLMKPARPDGGTSIQSHEYAIDNFLSQSKLHYVMFYIHAA